MLDNSNIESKNIHEEVIADIKKLLTMLPWKASNSDISKAMEKLEALIEPTHKELDESIQSLQKHANWDTFTIAFYGETNAGKSTTIETLRMVLDEETKKQSRLRFREIQEKDGLGMSSLTSLQMQINDGKKSVAPVIGSYQYPEVGTCD